MIVPALTTAAWRPYTDDNAADWRSGTRVVAVVPVRDDEGCWLGVPVAWTCLDEHPELVREAEKIAVKRYRRKIARATA
jgi:hypothetical protein